LVTHHKELYGYNKEYVHEYKEYHYGEIGNDVVKKLSDNDVSAILMLIDAVHHIKTLKLVGCVNMTGAGLEPRRGSTTLKHIDLSLVGPHKSPAIKPEPVHYLNQKFLPSLIALLMLMAARWNICFYPRRGVRSGLRHWINSYKDTIITWKVAGLNAQDTQSSMVAECFVKTQMLAEGSLGLFKVAMISLT